MLIMLLINMEMFIISIFRFIFLCSCIYISFFPLFWFFSSYVDAFIILKLRWGGVHAARKHSCARDVIAEKSSSVRDVSNPRPKIPNPFPVQSFASFSLCVFSRWLTPTKPNTPKPTKTQRTTTRRVRRAGLLALTFPPIISPF